MFNKVYDWAFDTDGLNARKKEAIDSILPLIDQIEQIWTTSLINEKYIADTLHTKASIYMLGGTDQLITLNESGKIYEFKKEYEINGNSSSTSSILAIKKALNLLNLSLPETNIIPLIKGLNNLIRLKKLSSLAKDNLYAENYQKIYNCIILISTIQKKYMDLKDTIGLPINIDNVLGDNGSKIKEKASEAMEYIAYLLQLASNLKTELSFIEARKISQEKRKFYKR